MGFSEQFISGYQSGQATRKQHLDQRREQARFDYETQDRATNKEILTHHLKRIKIEEQIEARKAALENLKALEGADAEDLTPDQTEGGMPGAVQIPQGDLPNDGVTPMPDPGAMATILNKMKQVHIPGIDELGVPGVDRRPKSMQQQLADSMTELRMKQNETIKEISPGASTARGTKIESTAPDRPGYVKVTERDANGVEVSHWVPKEELGSTTATKQPLPSQQLSTGEDLDEVADGVAAFDVPASKLAQYKGKDNLDLTARLRRKGFNLSKALAEERAAQKAMDTLNSGDRVDIINIADAAGLAMTDLRNILKPKEGQSGWKTEWGSVTWPNLQLAKIGRYGADAKEMAGQVEDALSAVREAVASVKSVGNQASNATIKASEEILQPSYVKDDLVPRLDRLLTNIGYRVAAIRNYTPTVVTPGSGKSAAVKSYSDADITAALKKKYGKDPTPEVVKQVSASPDLLKQLFGQ